MGWIEQVSTGVYRLGPNLLQEFHSDSIPTPTDILRWPPTSPHLLESGGGLSEIEYDV